MYQPWNDEKVRSRLQVGGVSEIFRFILEIIGSHFLISAIFFVGY
jgi:hypothetical protein